MPAPLPLELQQLILGYALAGPPTPQRQLTRHRLQLVCKAWQHSIGRWYAVDVFSVSQIVGVNRVLLNQRLVGDARLDVKAVHVGLTSAAVDERAGQKLTVLLSLVGQIERAEFVLGREGLVVKGGTDGSDSLGHGVRTALYQNSKLKHLKISGISNNDKVDVSAHLFDSLHYSWPDLESVTLNYLNIAMPYGREQLFARGSVRYPTGLRTLTIAADVRADVLAGLIAELPSSLVNVHITHPNIYTDAATAAEINKLLAPIAPRLRALSLLPALDGPTRSTVRPAPPAPSAPSAQAADPNLVLDLNSDSEPDIVGETPIASLAATRGCYNHLVAALASVRHLALAPSAVSDVALALSPLDQLRTARFAHAPGSCGTKLEFAEVVGLVNTSRLIEGVTVAPALVRKWTVEELVEVRAAAVRRSVCFSTRVASA